MKRYIKTAMVCVMVFSLCACNKFLEEKAYDFMGPDQVGYETEEDALIWANGAYNAMTLHLFSGSGVYDKMMELDSDYATGPSWAFGELGTGNFSQYWAAPSFWNSLYSVIDKCNNGIHYVNLNTCEEKAKNNALGLLYLLKGWAYFNLVRAYGPVPIYKNGIAYGDNPNPARSSIEEVYAYVIENLQLAESTLYKNTDASYKKGRPSAAAASGMLAKVYLTIASSAMPSASITVKGGPARRKIDATTWERVEPVAITHTKTAPLKGYEGFNAADYFELARVKAYEVAYESDEDWYIFPTYAETWIIPNRNTGDHMWSVQSIAKTVYSNQIAWSYRGSSPLEENIQMGCYATRVHWYKLFEDNDQRVVDGVLHRWKAYGAWHYYPAEWKNKVEDGEDGFEPTDVWLEDDNHIGRLRKFEASDRSTDQGDFHYPLLRFAEVVLTYAEAENEVNGPTAEAYNALNSLRSKRGASDAPVGMSRDQFRSFVIEESAREFALEGIRRWNLIRWGIYLNVMNAISGDGSASDENNVLKRRESKHLLFPLPINEINGNSSINENNPGW